MAPLKSLLLATVATIASADPNVFTVTISQPGGALNGQTVNAAGGAFYTGLEGPSTYCPPEQEPNCPAVTGTVFPNLGLAALNYLYVKVAGGQQTYQTTEGAFSFTPPISPGQLAKPQPQWKNFTVSDVEPTPFWVYNLKDNGVGKGGIEVCPTATEGIGQIYVQTPGFMRTDCIEVLGLRPVIQPLAYGCWEYV